MILPDMWETAITVPKRLVYFLKSNIYIIFRLSDLFVHTYDTAIY